MSSLAFRPRASSSFGLRSASTPCSFCCRHTDVAAVQQHDGAARSAGLRLAVLLALPLIARLSVDAMQRDWPG
ncbi:hypothetical protein [Mesorhizobium sp. M0217]|uniref:hypothetical protein n=1 Tax=unclassified Mesorhizobium TaxID=325217 RepID=UPI00333BD2F2